MSKMRVIHLIGGGDTGGAKTHVLHLLRELNRSIDAQLVCFRRGEFSDDAQRMGVPIHVIESGNPLIGLRELRKLLEGQRVDIIHCHGARGNLMGNLLKHFIKAPVVTTVHSDYRLDYLGRPVARLSYGTTNLVALRRMNYYIGVSDNITDLLIQRNFHVDRIENIHNGIDFTTPINCVPREEFLHSIGMEVKPGDVVAGIVARLSPVKDIPTLLRAMKLACEQEPRLKLAIAGDGEDKDKLTQLTEELGLSDRVCFAGWVKDVNSFFNAIDIALLTSLSEGFPYSLTEGARMHKATISTDVGGIPALIKDGETGILFTPRDEKALSRHLLDLARDPERRRALGDRLYEKAREEYSIESMVRRQLEIYNRILEREARKERRCKTRKERRDGVVVCGAYGHGNAGDDAILKSILHSVRELDEYVPITVLAKNTLSIKERYRVNAVYTFNIPKILWHMRGARLYINGGGTLIQNATSHRSLWYYLFTLWAAKRCGCKVAMYGCGIGPVKGKRNIKLASWVLNSSVDSITLREPDSVSELGRYGVNRPSIRLGSDPALVLKPAPVSQADKLLTDHGLDPEGKYICFLLRTWWGFSGKAPVLAAAAEYARDRLGLTPVFLSINSLQDGAAARVVMDKMKKPGILLDGIQSPELLISLLGRMSVVVSMRLHGLIFSSLSGAPLVGVSYDPKIGSFIRYLDYGEWIDLSAVTEEWLRTAIDGAVELLPKRQELREKTLRLIEVEKVNAQAVKELL
ncbi:polysaccharide pyruvyl transferase family protein [Acutalibacter sp. 1XD8-36]|uniref:polysaccharide pyruvyl transferase family protein n=1 Tax=Acutalibacter sp. 1XD8-36 TaxID=2320852 RepID=UPI001FAE1807|nr:polysaccharide pyruvyl transferase family protein [Acutalibacter sp. 1XD8-36]